MTFSWELYFRHLHIVLVLSTQIFVNMMCDVTEHMLPIRT